jgi:hypothetical protein
VNKEKQYLRASIKIISALDFPNRSRSIGPYRATKPSSPEHDRGATNMAQRGWDRMAQRLKDGEVLDDSDLRIMRGFLDANRLPPRSIPTFCSIAPVEIANFLRLLFVERFEFVERVYGPEAYGGKFLRFLASALRAYKLSGEPLSDNIYEAIHKYLDLAIARFEAETRSQTVLDGDLYYLSYLCLNHLNSLLNQASLGNQIAQQLKSGFPDKFELDFSITRETNFLVRRGNVPGWHSAFARLEDICHGASLVFHSQGEHLVASETLFNMIFRFLQAYLPSNKTQKGTSQSSLSLLTYA